jgi:hypothetical protein
MAFGDNLSLLRVSNHTWDETAQFTIAARGCLHSKSWDRAAGLSCDIILTFIRQLLLLLLWIYSPLLGPGRFFSFLVLYTVGRTTWTGDRPVARPLPTHRTTQTQNKCTILTSMPWVRFELTILVFEQAKTVHASDRAATVIGSFVNWNLRRQFLNDLLLFIYDLFNDAGGMSLYSVKWTVD